MDNYNKRSGGGGKKFGGDRGGRSFGGDRGGRSFGGGDRGGRSFGGDRGGDRGSRPDMHKAICDECKKSCEVPFRPTGDKPIFCSDCFRDKRGGDSQRGGDRGLKSRFESKQTYSGDAGKEAINYKAQFEVLNTKLDRIIKALGPAVSEEIKKVSEDPKYKTFEKAPKKEVDVVALKKAIAKTGGKKEVKKVPTKKISAKKEVVKKIAKKVTTKKKK